MTRIVSNASTLKSTSGTVESIGKVQHSFKCSTTRASGERNSSPPIELGKRPAAPWGVGCGSSSRGGALRPRSSWSPCSGSSRGALPRRPPRELELEQFSNINVFFFRLERVRSVTHALEARHQKLTSSVILTPMQRILIGPNFNSEELISLPLKRSEVLPQSAPSSYQSSGRKGER